MGAQFVAGGAAASLMIRLRVALAAQGGIQERDGIMLAVLPGADFTVGIRDGDRAQMHYPDGRPLSAVMDLSQPGQFTSLMHNVDVSIFGNDELERPYDRRSMAPISLAAFADAYAHAVLTGDARLGELVPREDLHYPDDGDSWSMGPLALRMAEAAAGSADPALSAAADAFLRDAASADRPVLRSLQSLIRWGRQVEGWLGRGVEPVASLDGHSWTRIVSDPGVIAAARELGWLEGQLKKGPVAEDREAAKPLSLRAEQILMDQMLAGHARPGYGDDGTQVYVLTDAVGRLVAAATVEDDEVSIRGPKGGEAGYEEHCDMLRSALGIEGPSYRI